MRIELWADVVCPFCYLGKRRLERALGAFEHRDETTVTHRAFQLDPSLPPGRAIPQLQVLMSKYRMSAPQVHAMQTKLEAQAKADDLDLRLVDGATGNTRDAHRLALFAGDRGAQPAVLEALYRAQFTEQRSIFDRASLLDLAEGAGLVRDEVAEVLDGDAYADAVRADGSRARELGVSGVPFLLIDGRVVVSGAQPRHVFSGALSDAWQTAHA